MRHWGWPLYFLLVASLVPIAAYHGATPRVQEAVRGFILEFSTELWAGGTVFLVALLSMFTVIISNLYADSRERETRLNSANMKIAEFRQEWINGLRSELSELIFHARYDAPGSSSDILNERSEELKRLNAQIHFRLNPREGAANLLRQEVDALVASFDRLVATGVSDNSSNLLTSFCASRKGVEMLGAEYLKGEWEVVKRILQDAKSN